MMVVNLQKARMILHLSLDYVAKEIGITPTELLAIECGDKQPNKYQVVKLMHLYGLDDNMRFTTGSVKPIVQDIIDVLNFKSMIK